MFHAICYMKHLSDKKLKASNDQEHWAPEILIDIKGIVLAQHPWKRWVSPVLVCVHTKAALHNLDVHNYCLMPLYRHSVMWHLGAFSMP